MPHSRTTTNGGHKDLMGWQLAIEFAEAIYAATRSFPRDELYGIVSQLRRAAVSIPSNVAEGYGRHSARELHRFVNSALGSLLEVETQMELSQRLGYVNRQTLDHLLQKSNRLKQVLQGLRAWADSEPTGWISSKQDF